MKIDLKKIQDLQKSGQKYNRNDIAISGCLLMLKVEGYDVSFINSYDDLKIWKGKLKVSWIRRLKRVSQ